MLCRLFFESKTDQTKDFDILAEMDCPRPGDRLVFRNYLKETSLEAFTTKGVVQSIYFRVNLMKDIDDGCVTFYKGQQSMTQSES